MFIFAAHSFKGCLYREHVFKAKLLMTYIFRVRLSCGTIVTGQIFQEIFVRSEPHIALIPICMAFIDGK